MELLIWGMSKIGRSTFRYTYIKAKCYKVVTKIIFFRRKKKMKKYLDMTNEEYKMKLARRIKQLRKSRGMTQEELAEVLGTNHSFIARMEKGFQDSRITSLLVVARALGVTVGELVTV